jgi:hypothetical protein
MTFLYVYLRVFSSPTFRQVTYGTIIFVFFAAVSNTAVNTFQCRPVSYAWTKWDGKHEGHCLNMNAQAWANAAISIALDIWIIGLPLQQVVGLSWDWRKKWQAMAMFSIGLLYVSSSTHNPDVSPC